VSIRVVLGVGLVIVHRELGKNFRQGFPSEMVVGLLSLVHPVQPSLQLLKNQTSLSLSLSLSLCGSHGDYSEKGR
jgi:hypothetical protein